MKAVLTFLSFTIMGLLNIPTEINKEVTTNGRTYLYGEINRTGLTSGQYKRWFDYGYSRYQFDESVLSEIQKKHLEGITIKLFMGTWCGDSKRNVPVFFKFMDAVGIKDSQLQSWALDLRKRGPNNEHINYVIRRVPTIVFYRNGKEIGRFIERPKPGQKMEKLWADILTNP